VVKKSIVLAVVLCAFSICRAGEPGMSVAKVDMRELEPLLLEVAFKKPENQLLRDWYAELQEQERAMRSGEVDIEEAARSFVFDRIDNERAVEDLAKGELIVLIEDMFGDRYQLVVNDGYGGGILYTQIAIPDITPNIKQRLLTDRIASQTRQEDSSVHDAPPEDVPVE
jgi:hypothetical protein